jgi:succinate dehydrogenase/fumarate reductase cytochrome b subunit (b558 family)
VSDPALPSRSESAPLLARRLLSLSGVVPLGAFLLVHLVVNAYAVRGSLAFADAVGAVQRIPALGLVEALFVFAPLALHALLGLWLILANKPLTTPSPYGASLRRAMRATGVLAIAFLAMHLPELRFRTRGPSLDGGQLATLLAYDLSSTSHGVPWRGVAYLFGTGCVVFHFAAGLWGFFAASRRGRKSGAARRFAAWLAMGLGAALWFAFADIVVFHAAGVGFL